MATFAKSAASAGRVSSILKPPQLSPSSLAWPLSISPKPVRAWSSPPAPRPPQSRKPLPAPLPSTGTNFFFTSSPKTSSSPSPTTRSCKSQCSPSSLPSRSLAFPKNSSLLFSTLPNRSPRLCSASPIWSCTTRPLVSGPPWRTPSATWALPYFSRSVSCSLPPTARSSLFFCVFFYRLPFSPAYPSAAFSPPSLNLPPSPSPPALPKPLSLAPWNAWRLSESRAASSRSSFPLVTASIWMAPRSISRSPRFSSRRPQAFICPGRSSSSWSWCLCSPAKVLPESPAPLCSCCSPPLPCSISPPNPSLSSSAWTRSSTWPAPPSTSRAIVSPARSSPAGKTNSPINRRQHWPQILRDLCALDSVPSALKSFLEFSLNLSRRAQHDP